jgi:hypothetical protein
MQVPEVENKLANQQEGSGEGRWGEKVVDNALSIWGQLEQNPAHSPGNRHGTCPPPSVLPAEGWVGELGC